LISVTIKIVTPYILKFYVKLAEVPGVAFGLLETFEEINLSVKKKL